MGCELTGLSLECGLHSLQSVVDSSRLTLAGLLKVGIIVSCQKVDVRVGEPGNMAVQVGLKVSVWLVRVQSLLEGVDLTHDLCYAPGNSSRWNA